MNEKGDELKVKDLKQVMNSKFRFLVAKGKVTEEEEDDDDDGSETVLGAMNFPGKCYKCGQKGHKANSPSCPLYRENNFIGKCNKCGMRGHKEKDCWEDEANKDKRPTGWKSRLKNDEERDDEERNNFARDNNEYLLL